MNPAPNSSRLATLPWIEYDPVSGNAYLSIGPSLWEVELDSAAPPVLVGNFAQTVSNLQYLPICQ